MHSLLYYGFNYGRKRFYDTAPRDLYYKPFYSCNKLAGLSISLILTRGPVR
jgi:hypothetical protein